jgi:hypothetical protein
MLKLAGQIVCGSWFQWNSWQLESSLQVRALQQPKVIRNRYVSCRPAFLATLSASSLATHRPQSASQPCCHSALSFGFAGYNLSWASWPRSLIWPPRRPRCRLRPGDDPPVRLVGRPRWPRYSLCLVGLIDGHISATIRSALSFSSLATICPGRHGHNHSFGQVGLVDGHATLKICHSALLFGLVGRDSRPRFRHPPRRSR